MTTWHKRDWEQFYELARRPWRRHRPPRPVYPTGLNRVLPAQGFSLSELDDAGVDLDLAERLGLPVDAGRIRGLRTERYGSARFHPIFATAAVNLVSSEARVCIIRSFLL